LGVRRQPTYNVFRGIWFEALPVKRKNTEKYQHALLRSAWVSKARTEIRAPLTAKQFSGASGTAKIFRNQPPFRRQCLIQARWIGVEHPRNCRDAAAQL